MSSKILDRIAAQTGVPNLPAILSEELSSSDLQSLLLHVYGERTSLLREAGLMQRADRDLLQPSKIDARLLHTFEGAAFEAAAGFEAIELAPVCPLGLSRVLGEIHQNNVLTTVRNAEVLGDPTPVLALECAKRRKIAGSRSAAGAVRLCSSHRVVRLQSFDVPGFVPHFRLFALATAGRDLGAHAFETQHLGEHIRFYLSLFRVLNSRGFSFANPLVELTDTAVVEALLARAGIAIAELRQSIRAHRPGESERFLAAHGISLPDAIEDPERELPNATSMHPLARLKVDLLDGLAREFPEAKFRFNLARLEGLSYYRGLCLRISPEAPDGSRHAIVDGGFTDWTARLLEDRKERFLATGIGSEFACFQYLLG